MNPPRTDAIERRLPSTQLEAFGQVLVSLDALRNGPALMMLLATFAAAGLLLAMAESSLARAAVG